MSRVWPSPWPGALVGRGAGQFPVLETRAPCTATPAPERSEGTTNGHRKGNAREGDHAGDDVRQEGLPDDLQDGPGHDLVQGETPTDHGLNIPAHESLVGFPMDLIRKAFQLGS